MRSPRGLHMRRRSCKSKYKQAHKVAVIHDVMDYVFKNHSLVLPDATRVPDAKQKGTALFDSGGGILVPGKYDLGPSSNFRNDKGTLLESNAIIYAARHMKMPLYAGPSYTTGRMMQFATWAGASDTELEALAWALFAFWNQDYYQSQTMVHTFHEVMDMANNYGVDYTVFEYPDAPPADRNIVVIDLAI